LTRIRRELRADPRAGALWTEAHVPPGEAARAVRAGTCGGSPPASENAGARRAVYSERAVLKPGGNHTRCVQMSNGKVGRVTPCAPSWRILTRWLQQDGAHGATRPTNPWFEQRLKKYFVESFPKREINSLPSLRATR